jgi:hypothetical protein
MESKRRDSYSKEVEAKVDYHSLQAPARSMVTLMKNANLTESDEKYALH